jgi:hypothetical protein
MGSVQRRDPHAPVTRDLSSPVAGELKREITTSRIAEGFRFEAPRDKVFKTHESPLVAA